MEGFRFTKHKLSFTDQVDIDFSLNLFFSTEVCDLRISSQSIFRFFTI